MRRDNSSQQNTFLYSENDRSSNGDFLTSPSSTAALIAHASNAESSSAIDFNSEPASTISGSNTGNDNKFSDHGSDRNYNHREDRRIPGSENASGGNFEYDVDEEDEVDQVNKIPEIDPVSFNPKQAIATAMHNLYEDERKHLRNQIPGSDQQNRPPLPLPPPPPSPTGRFGFLGKIFSFPARLSQLKDRLRDSLVDRFDSSGRHRLASFVAFFFDYVLKSRYVAILLSFSIYLVFCQIDLVGAKNPSGASRIIGITLCMSILWFTSVIPLAVTSLLPVVLFPISGVQSGADVSSAYFNQVSMIFLGGFIYALAMERWNLHKRIGLFTMIRFGSRLGLLRVMNLPGGKVLSACPQNC